MCHAKCNLTLKDKLLNKLIDCEIETLKKWYDKVGKIGDEKIDSAISTCIAECGKCGEALLCMNNTLGILDGLTIKCDIVQDLVNKCKVCNPLYKKALQELVESCKRNNGNLKKTIEGVKDSELIKPILGQIK